MKHAKGFKNELSLEGMKRDVFKSTIQRIK